MQQCAFWTFNDFWDGVEELFLEIFKEAVE